MNIHKNSRMQQDLHSFQKWAENFVGHQENPDTLTPEIIHHWIHNDSYDLGSIPLDYSPYLESHDFLNRKVQVYLYHQKFMRPHNNVHNSNQFSLTPPFGMFDFIRWIRVDSIETDYFYLMIGHIQIKMKTNQQITEW